MDITRTAEKACWSDEATEKMRKNYGSGPFTVLHVSVRRGHSCSPDEHLHVTVKLSGGKPGTFCGKFFQSM